MKTFDWSLFCQDETPMQILKKYYAMAIRNLRHQSRHRENPGRLKPLQYIYYGDYFIGATR